MSTALAGLLVGPGVVEDTTDDAAFTPVRVTAHMAEPVIGLAEHPCVLDGPAQAGAYTLALAAGADLPPLTRDWALDFAMPVATWTAAPSRPDADARLHAADAGLVWGWACSRALYDSDEDTVAQVRRKPAVDAMVRYSPERRFHAGLGPHKARDTVYPAVFARRVEWFALADPAGLARILEQVTHLGAGRVRGHGRVMSWQVQADPAAAELWRQRPWPDPAGAPGAIRAPYWHPSRAMPCRG